MYVLGELICFWTTACLANVVTSPTFSCCAVLNRTIKKRQVTEDASLKLKKKDHNIYLYKLVAYM